jgi:hypothetical protein
MAVDDMGGIHIRSKRVWKAKKREVEDKRANHHSIVEIGALAWVDLASLLPGQPPKFPDDAPSCVI